MEKVTGIGGLFFRARDPKALAEWYSKYLGVDVVPSSYDQLPWQQQAGPTAFAPFPEDTDYFARIHDLEGNAVELWEPAGRDAFLS